MCVHVHMVKLEREPCKRKRKEMVREPIGHDKRRGEVGPFRERKGSKKGGRRGHKTRRAIRKGGRLEQSMVTHVEVL